MPSLEWTTHDGRKALSLDDRAPSYLVKKGTLLEARTERIPDAVAAIVLTKRGWGVLDFSGNDTFVNGLRVADFKSIQHGDKIAIGDVVSLFHEISQITLPSDSAVLQKGDKCLVCYSGFEPGQTVVPCPVCQAVHHQDCWGFNEQACASCGHRVSVAAEKSKSVPFPERSRNA